MITFARNRVPAAVLVSAVTAVLLVGCGSNTEPMSASSTESTPSTHAPQPHPSSARPSVLAPDSTTEAVDTTITFTLEYVRGGRLGRSSAVRGVARQSPVVAGGLAWKVTPDRDGSFRPLIEMCSRTCRCVKVCRRNHPDEPTAHGRTVWTKRSG